VSFAPDSRTAGYLGPKGSPDPVPLESDPWEDFCQQLVAGVTGLPGNRVFPRWQIEEPNHPAIGIDWAAVGSTAVEADWQPAVIHVDVDTNNPDGVDYLQRMETNTLLVSFYGPNASAFAGMIRDGLFVEQNSAELRRSAVGLVEVQGFVRTPELFRQRWIQRVDVPIVLRREIRRNYPVLNLLRAQGTITANRPYGSTDVLHDDFDTVNEE
jgi:hypothetical protein